jgi:chaperone modulatory protein CbpM
MPMQHIDFNWLDEREVLSVAELSHVCGMSVEALGELVDYGALMPLEVSRSEHFFSAACVAQLRVLGRLRNDFELDVFTLALLMGYLARIEVLERQIGSLQAVVPTRFEL